MKINAITIQTCMPFEKRTHNGGVIPHLEPAFAFRRLADILSVGILASFAKASIPSRPFCSK